METAKNGGLNLKALADFFPASDIEWKPITISKKTNKGLAAAYVTNRAVMQRLDDVCGPENWKNEFRPGPDGGVLCGLSINVTGNADKPTWVTKHDAAENSDIEPVKGGISGAMRRAAVHWGIGRYLYDLPSQWVPVNEYKKFKKTPSVPSQYLPDGDNSNSRPSPKAKGPRPTSNGQAQAQRRGYEWYADKIEAIKGRLSSASYDDLVSVANSVEEYVADWPDAHKDKVMAAIKARHSDDWQADAPPVVPS